MPEFEQVWIEFSAGRLIELPERGLKGFAKIAERPEAHRTPPCESFQEARLPITLFKRVFISNRDRYVIFDPQ
ncbi:MAG: hypothetical protein WCA10_07200 [Terracidiphilus sp.]